MIRSINEYFYSLPIEIQNKINNKILENEIKEYNINKKKIIMKEILNDTSDCTGDPYQEIFYLYSDNVKFSPLFMEVSNKQ